MSRFKVTNFIPKIKFDKKELKERLSPMQYNVTQEKGTERPFSGQYYSLKEDGTYICVVCNEKLFKSSHKFDSGCGWPSFYDALDSANVHLSPDYSHVGSNLLLLLKNKDLVRTEVSCSNCGAHLGHLFDDGPSPTKLRYCINSNSLNFKSKKEEK